MTIVKPFQGNFYLDFSRSLLYRKRSVRYRIFPATLGGETNAFFSYSEGVQTPAESRGAFRSKKFGCNYAGASLMFFIGVIVAYLRIALIRLDLLEKID